MVILVFEECHQLSVKVPDVIYKQNSDNYRLYGLMPRLLLPPNSYQCAPLSLLSWDADRPVRRALPGPRMGIWKMENLYRANRFSFGLRHAV